MLQTLGFLGPYKKEREEIMHKLHQDHGPMWKIDETVITSATGDIKPAAKLKDIIGLSLPNIGSYKSLDNTRQVVALIDDVSTS